MKSLLRVACSPRTVTSAVRVAAVVGTVLNGINQGEAFQAGAGVSWLHLVLNYLVPYCVAGYSAANSEMNRPSDERPLSTGGRG